MAAQEIQQFTKIYKKHFHNIDINTGEHLKKINESIRKSHQ